MGDIAVHRPDMLCGAQFNVYRQLLLLDTAFRLGICLVDRADC